MRLSQLALCPVAGWPARIWRHCESISITSDGKGPDLLDSINAVYGYHYAFISLRIC
jgi:hypothetical protein